MKVNKEVLTLTNTQEEVRPIIFWILVQNILMTSRRDCSKKKKKI